MSLQINDRLIDQDAITREAALYGDAPDPEAAARRSLAVRELLLQRAGELGMLAEGRSRAEVTFASRAEEDGVIAAVLDAEVRTPRPTEAECRRFHAMHPTRFTSGELVEVRHILFAVTPAVPVMALRQHAQAVLAALRKAPDTFADVARTQSNCPSGAQDGSLGQFGRGTMVPEFERAVFGTTATGILPELVATRHGFHIVDVARRIPGAAVPFEAVAQDIAHYLTLQVEAQALRQYIALLAGQASIAGADLAEAGSPLLQ